MSSVSDSKIIGGWRNGSAVNSTYYSWGELGFSSQNPHQIPYNCVTLGLGDPVPSGYLHTHGAHVSCASCAIHITKNND